MKANSIHINNVLGFSILLLPVLLVGSSFAQPLTVKLIEVESGWAKNSINAVIFRKNVLVTYQGTQFISFYDKNGLVVIEKRKSRSAEGELKTTAYKGNTSDAHNTISMMVDGDGFIHLSWDHHNNPINYCRSVKPGSSYDMELWKEKRLLHLFVEKVEQVDGEGKSEFPAQMIRVLEWKPAG